MLDHMKPILFNTEMARAILEGRKTVTRRVVRPQPTFFYKYGGKIADPDNPDNIAFLAMAEKNGEDKEEICVPPYQPGSILYVRETWYYETFYEDTDNAPDLPSGKRSWRYVYKADNPDYPVIPGHWHPSIHMPREAARIFLRVTNVRVEQLQDITDDDMARDFDFCLNAIKAVGRDALAGPFWDNTIKPADRALYGWEANPWVWVIAFERISKEKAYEKLFD